jgi:nitrate/nitrite transporter NarK
MNLGAIFNGIAGTVFFAGPALLASIWFPPGQRTTATAITSFVGNVGFAATFILGNLNQIITQISTDFGPEHILKFITTPCMSSPLSLLEHQRQLTADLGNELH